MGNSFIGFPVPRAKIADMIIGEAAPKEHHTNHEAGGDDEIDCTGLAGAGGGALPFDDLHYHEYFTHIDGFAIVKTGGGQGDVIGGQLNCIPEYSADSLVRIRKDTGYLYVAWNWGKNRELRTRANLYAEADAGLTGYLGTGDLRVGYGFGFVYINSHLFARTKSSAGITDVEIYDFSTYGIDGNYNLRARLTAGEKVDFWFNNALVATITTTLPSGTTYGGILLYVEADNNNTGSEIEIQMYEYQLYQAG